MQTGQGLPLPSTNNKDTNQILKVTGLIALANLEDVAIVNTIKELHKLVIQSDV